MKQPKMDSVTECTNCNDQFDYQQVLETKTVGELKQMASICRIKRYGGLSKRELVSALLPRNY